MVRGLYTAYTGMINEQKRLDVVSNNLANAATVGFKADNITNQSFDDALTLKIKDNSTGIKEQKIGYLNSGVKTGEIYTDHGQGSFRQTEGTFDLGIEGKGFFRIHVADADGNIQEMYTRDGIFTMSKEGYVMDKNGNRLVGEGGEIQISSITQKVAIDETGKIFADGVFVDRIDLADFEDYEYLEKHGDNLFRANDGITEIPVEGVIKQGYTEQSNVNAVSEMIDMIVITRAYETNQKVIKAVDEMIGKAVNEVAKV